MTITNTQVYRSVTIHSDRLGEEKKKFVLNVLNAHGPEEALKALYIALFVVKTTRELLIFQI
jgi:hypothetical protein